MMDELNSTCVEDYTQFIDDTMWNFIESSLSPKLLSAFNIAFEEQFVDSKFPALASVMEELRNRLPTIVDSAFETIADDVDSVSVSLEDDKKKEVAGIMKMKVGEWVPLVLDDTFKEKLKNQLDAYVMEKMGELAEKFNQNGVNYDSVMRGLLEGLNEKMQKVFREQWQLQMKKERTVQYFEDKKKEMITGIANSLNDIAKKASEEKKEKETSLTNAMNLPSIPQSLLTEETPTPRLAVLA